MHVADLGTDYEALRFFYACNGCENTFLSGDREPYICDCQKQIACSVACMRRISAASKHVCRNEISAMDGIVYRMLKRSANFPFCHVLEGDGTVGFPIPIASAVTHVLTHPDAFSTFPLYFESRVVRHMHQHHTHRMPPTTLCVCVYQDEHHRHTPPRAGPRQDQAAMEE